MEQFLDAARAFVLRFLALTIVFMGGVWMLSLALPKLALAATCFIATPGGLVIALIGWRYLRRRRK